ncbi:MscL family protein [Candidatus Woesebacteria bacterium]|nr:MscL family protein [Candidatus Woesebacteria bacterium]
MKGFMNFIREQGVVGLAVGFILGGAVSKVVSSLSRGYYQPSTWNSFGCSRESG